jgi:hypothetical protein
LQTLSRLAGAPPPSAYCATPALLRQRLAAAGSPSNEVMFRRYAIAVGIDGRAPGMLMAQVSAPTAMFCAADGSAVFGGGEAIAARVAAGGIFHVLRVDATQ